MQAYVVDHLKKISNRQSAACGPPSEAFSDYSEDASGRIENKGALIDSIDSIYRTLTNLLRAKLISRVHVSHFRSDTDNHTEADKVVPPTEEYKGKSRREREAQKEAAIKRKLKDWRYYMNSEEDVVEDLKKGKKRPRQDIEPQPSEKRRRPSSALSQKAICTMEEVYQSMLGTTGYLDVRNWKLIEKWLGN